MIKKLIALILTALTINMQNVEAMKKKRAASQSKIKTLWINAAERTPSPEQTFDATVSPKQVEEKQDNTKPTSSETPKSSWGFKTKLMLGLSIAGIAIGGYVYLRPEQANKQMLFLKDFTGNVFNQLLTYIFAKISVFKTKINCPNGLEINEMKENINTLTQIIQNTTSEALKASYQASLETLKTTLQTALDCGKKA